MNQHKKRFIGNLLAVNNGEVKTLLFGVLFTTVTTTTTTILDWRTDPPPNASAVCLF